MKGWSKYKMILEALHTPDDGEKVWLETYTFTCYSNDWWSTVKTSQPMEHMTWTAFITLFLDNYFFYSEKEAPRTEIFTFTQMEDMIVSEYLAKFTSLPRFAPQIMLIDTEKALKF